MAIQPLVARDDQFQAHAIGHQLRRDVTPEECYQCEFAYQYVRQMQRNERLCAGDAFYDLYSICVGCIEDNIDSGIPREYVEPNLGRYVDYCTQFTTLTKWASMGATSATSATAAEKTDGTVIDEASITGRIVEQLETSIVATTNTIPQTTTEVAQSEDSASSPNFPKKDSSSFSKAWIAGAFVPSVLFVAMAVAFAIWWRRRRSRTPKTPKSLHADDMVGTSRFDKPELDSQGIPRPSNKEEVITSTRTAALDTVVLPVPADMPANDAPGSLNRAELQGEAKAARDKIMAPELTTSF
ncbi:hypothetical protein Forpe1208_v012814 [Fusarium oxysporum f. sp. rapae]|uniref:Uncharacterized protein n=1 Tax=Fusarium oxysporum f. sp. rapae TaxID=485398 RepID=A0A8J5NLU6_FUSOX|nr:hypothetical protein Forpe1208_v012814 [Fusarium oxysporum f. sp. rapae]